MMPPEIVTRNKWLVARKAHLKNKKAFTRMLDPVSAGRRARPQVLADKEYVLQASGGKIDLLPGSAASRQRLKIAKADASCRLDT